MNVQNGASLIDRTNQMDTITGTSRSTDANARRMPIGAEVLPEGGVHFRVWAPKCESVSAQLSRDAKFSATSTQLVGLSREEGGYFSGLVADAAPGMFYRFKLPGGAFPDPASRFQPEGPHGPSQIVDAGTFRWTDEAWRGVSRQGQVIYELHIGTFTSEGTWPAAQGQLPELARMGVTLVEVMPVADFPGRFGWGYDGVNMFAPTRLYGKPDEFRAFVDRAHGLGLGVILDVVYNHFGPDGNYLKQFSDDYTHGEKKTEWGEGLNFDGENSGPVREFFLANAVYWIDEFHLDGLRLDATHQMHDESEEHILAALDRETRAAARGRGIYLVAENESQEARLARSREQGGCGLDAIWNDDFHHSATVALTGRNEAYYSDYRGAPQEFISAAKRGFLYQGQWYSWQKKRRGKPAFDLSPEQFVLFLENHDQVANSLRGLRMWQSSAPGRYRAMTALLLLGPGTPLLFQGQEFAASAPFLYFADHQSELAQAVAAGRREFLKQFPCLGDARCDSLIANPAAAETFTQCKLDFAERQKHRHTYDLHRDLLRLRREEPVLARPRKGGMDGAVIGPEAFVLRFFGDDGDDRLLLVNLGTDLRLSTAPEPLLASVEGCAWMVKWSSEDPRYGGSGMPPLESEGVWRLPGNAAIWLTPTEEIKL